MILTTATTLNKTAISTKGELRSLTTAITGPDESTPSTELIYKVTSYSYVQGVKGNTIKITEPTPNQLEVLEADKDNILWVMWVNGGLMDARSDYITIVSRNLIAESNNDFTKITKKQDFINTFNDNGYLEAKVETIIENGLKVNQLKIKLSKWLDGRDIHVEAYRGSVSHNSAEAWVKKTTVKALPEITNTSWVNSQLKRITSIGYESDIFFSFESLGLKDKQVTIQLFDEDSVTDNDALLWNDGLANYTFTVVNRTMLIPYNVEKMDSAAYTNGFGDVDDLLDSDLELYVKLSTNEEQITIPEDTKFAEILLTPNQNVSPYFATSEEVTDGVNTYTRYNPVENLYPGSKVTLVAECTNIPDNSIVSFSIVEQAPVLSAINTNLPLIEKGVEKTLFTTTVTNGFAAIELFFQEPYSEKFKAWNELLTPEPIDTESILTLKASINADEYISSNNLKIKAPINKYLIFHNHVIQKKTLTNAIAGDYAYTDEFGVVHDLGRVPYHKITNNYAIKYGSKYDSSIVKLVDVRESEGYSNHNNEEKYEFNGGTIDIKISFNTSKNNRYFMNEDTWGCFLGAIMKCNLKDITFNGFSKSDGSPSPSTTHKNGYNGDFRYLRKDKSGGHLYLDKDITVGQIAGWPDLDLVRQEKLINTLFLFGWKSFVSQKYGPDEKTLTKITVDSGGDHYNHLHIQGFQHTSIILIDTLP